mgnify:FL=1
MNEFEFELGVIVVVDPTGRGKGAKGKVVGHTKYIDGSVGYLVSCADYVSGAVARYHLHSSDIYRASDHE